MELTFVVGTGRCGSTLLSRLLREHPDVLSMSEFFSTPRIAAALLLAGSGPTDRDGDQPAQKVTPQTLKLVAGVLAQQGIMTLRFDKYFTGQTGAGAFASDPQNIDLNAYIRQADAAYAFLRGQPTADPQHLLVVGHSEGGFYAMLVADTVSAHPAGLDRKSVV